MLEDPFCNYCSLPAVVSNQYLPSHGIPLLGLWHCSKKSCPKGCKEVVKLSHSRTGGPTPCPPACPYLAPQPSLEGLPMVPGGKSDGSIQIWTRTGLSHQPRSACKMLTGTSLGILPASAGHRVPLVLALCSPIMQMFPSPFPSCFEQLGP